MSGGAKPTFLMPAYDSQELRRRMAVGFTIGELYRLAEKLGVPAVPSWSGSPQDAARDIVRHFERSGALPFLVEALQEAKPFIEWPAPLPPPEASPFAAPPPATSSAAAPPGATSFEAPVSAAFDDAPTAVDPPADRPTPISTLSAAAVFASSAGRSSPPGPAPGGFAPAVMPRPGEAAPALPASSAPPPAASPRPVAASSALPASNASAPSAPSSAASAARPGGTEVDSDLAAFMAAGTAPPQPVIRDPALSPAAAWPGTVRPPDKPAPRTTLDYRLVAGGGAALLIIAVAIAFFVGRASSAAEPGDAEGASSGASSSGPPGDQVALAKHVVGALGESLSRVASDCQIDLSTLRGRSLFEVAYRRCGPLSPEALVPGKPSSYDPGPVVLSQPDVPAPDPAGKARPSGNNKLQKVDTGGGAPAPGGSGCLSRCTRSHAACTSGCGAEPKQGSQYDAYQSCLGGCLKALSQCKLACQ